MGAFLCLREVVTVALTDKQKRFVEEYLVDLNATQAAISLCGITSGY
ncbi:MAG: terminase small subunit [Lawsonibacter sp.]|nr:terminase small subunit [Lawsonibacter sp.]